MPALCAASDFSSGFFHHAVEICVLYTSPIFLALKIPQDYKLLTPRKLVSSRLFLRSIRVCGPVWGPYYTLIITAGGASLQSVCSRSM